MTTIIINGLKSNKLVTCGYGSAPVTPTPTIEPVGVAQPYRKKKLRRVWLIIQRYLEMPLP
jgi:hypothetical protein